MDRFFNLHRTLVQSGYFRAGQKLLNLLRVGQVTIGDGDNESWQSGLADFLMEHCRYANRRGGFTAYLRREAANG